MEKKSMMVDMDDVICQCRFLDLMNKFLGTDYQLDDFEEYYLNVLLANRVNEFWEINKDENLYEGVPLFLDCYDVLKEYSKYLDIYITTAYLWNGIDEISAKNLYNKFMYLKENLPFISASNFCFVTNKSRMNFDIRLDDKLTNLTNGELKMMYTQWHNKKITDEELNSKGIIRVNNWKEIDKVLAKKLCVK